MNRKVEDRDDKGRFLTGNNGGGRPVGSRNRLAVEFVDGLASEFAARGQQAIKQVCKNDPVAFLKIVSSVLPREVLLKATLNVTATDEYEDFAQYIADWRLARQRIGISEDPPMITINAEAEDTSDE
jgi:hypothetical protein